MNDPTRSPVTDIPLRDQLARTVAFEILWGAQSDRFKDWPVPLVRELTFDVADDILERFDIQLRSPHPIPDANEET